MTNTHSTIRNLLKTVESLKAFISLRVDDTIQRRELFHKVDKVVAEAEKTLEEEPNEFDDKDE